jgi:hypothetical protein
MSAIDTASVAGRLRHLVGSRTVKDAANQLGVSEAALRLSIDADAPHPTIEVLIAAAQRFGVDPTWILTGEYDGGTHRRLLDGAVDDVAQAVRRLLTTDPVANAATPAPMEP